MLETEIKKLTVAVEALTKATLESAGTPTVAAVAAAKPAAAAPAADTTIEIPADTPVAAPPADKKQVVEGIIALAKAKGREAAAALLAEYGATKVPELKDKSVYGEIVAKIDAILAS